MDRSPGANRRRLGQKLQQLRKAAGKTQAGIAERLGVTQGTISKIEARSGHPTLEQLDFMIVEYRVTDDEAKQLRELFHSSDILRPAPGQPRAAEAFRRLIDLEPVAKEIRSWRSERIPGPLQSEMYMARVFELDKPGRRQFVDDRVHARTMRALDLFEANPAPHYRTILSEGAFLRLPGGRSAAMEADQIRHLLRVARKYRQFDLHILEFSAKVFPDSDFAVLHFEDPAQDFVYTEYPGEAYDRKETKACDEHWEMLLAAALDHEKSIAYLERRLGVLRRELMNSYE